MFRLLFLVFIISSAPYIYGQSIEFSEYKLKNGLHVILHQDTSVPVVVTSVMYHVGSKDENPNRTGFAHFFEHLLFEGTKNIPKGQFFKLVEQNGGRLNANTTADRTYYYEILPSNKLELGLWLESERMLHPVINQKGVDTQNEVVKEEKRLRVDNRPYGKILEIIQKSMFKKHPYRWSTIGSMAHLDAANLNEFLAFNKTFYVPNNAVLVVAGNFDKEDAKKKINAYFGSIKRSKKPPKVAVREQAITKESQTTVYDPNIQIPAIIATYRTPGMTAKDTYVLNMISTLLSGSKSSRLYKKMVDKQKIALEATAVNLSFEDYGAYAIFALPLGKNTLKTLLKEIDIEILRLQNELISENEFKKLQNIMENRFVSSNSSMAGIANALARSYMLYKNTQLVNQELDIYRSITRQDIQEVSKKYLNKNQRVVINYLPQGNQSK